MIPKKREAVSRLREARFGGRSKVGQDHAGCLKDEGQDTMPKSVERSRTISDDVMKARSLDVEPSS
jgi:hypothetical protein